MNIGKYEVKIVFRFQSIWIGIYPNKLEGKLCIAFLPFCILRIINTKKHYQCENAMLKDALEGALDVIATKHNEPDKLQYANKNSGKTYGVRFLRLIINNKTIGN